MRGELAGAWHLTLAVAAAVVCSAHEVGAQDVPAPELRVASVEVRFTEALEPPLELPRLELRAGAPYTQERIVATESALLAALAERGRPHGTVEISADVVGEAAAVVLDVDPGPPVVFGEISVQAEPPLEEADILERVEYRPGEPFRQSALAETQAALRGLPVVQEVVISTVGLATGETTVPTTITVTTPERVRGVEVQGSVSSIRCLEAAAYWRDRYFMGSPRIFSIGGGLSNLFAKQVGDNFPCSSVGDDEFSQVNYFVDTELQQNLPGRPRTSILTRVFFRQTSSPRAYALRGFGGRIGIAHNFLRGRTVSLGYAPERNRLRGAGIYVCAELGACTAEEIAAFSRDRWLAPIEASAQWLPPGSLELLRPPGTEDPTVSTPTIQPLWRPFANIALSTAARPTGSDFRYGRAVGEVGATRSTGLRTEVAARLRLGGLARGDQAVPPQIRFYAGGVNSVRGVQQNLLGPLVLLASENDLEELGCQPVPGGCPSDLHVDPDLVSVRPRGGDAVVESSVEGRVWVGSTFQLAAFVDYGLVVGRAFSAQSAGGNRRGSVATPGIGVRVPTRLGPIRVDVGYDPRGDQRLPLVTEDPNSDDIIVVGDVIWNPFTFGDPSSLREFWRRLQFQLSLGQPF